MNILQNLFSVKWLQIFLILMNDLVKLIKGRTCNKGSGPRYKGSISMLSEYIGVDVFLRYTVVLRKSAAETGRIQGNIYTYDYYIL